MPVRGKETMDEATPGNATAIVVVVVVDVGGVFFFTRFALQRGFSLAVPMPVWPLHS